MLVRRRVSLVRHALPLVMLLSCVLGLPHPAQCQKSESSQKGKPASSTAKPGNKSAPPTIFDRAKEKDDDADFIVVPAQRTIMVTVTSPAGSPLTTEVTEGKVTTPVRVGFATAIPAGSKVRLRFASSTECGPVYDSTECGRLYELVSVEIRGTIYQTETDQAGYSPSEMRFTLVKRLRIAR